MSSARYDILISHVDYLTPQMTIEKDASIAIADGVIKSFSGDPSQAQTVIDGSGLFVMPGLTDAHIHTSQQLLRGRLLDEKPVIWKRVNVPFESRLTEETSALSASLAALEMIGCGTTSFVDAGGHFPEVFAEIYGKAGMRGRLSFMTNDNPMAPDSLRSGSPAEGVRFLRRMKKRLDSTGSDRLLPVYSVTTPTAVSEELYREVLNAAIEDGVPFETHLNEYASEVTEFIERYGERPFVWLEKQGLVPEQFLAAHAIFLSDDEIDIIADRKIRIAHCPFSNSGKGIPRTPQLLHRGISCGFGSDGAGHGGLDLFREMRLFRCLMNVTHGISSADSSVMPAETLLIMATQGGASALFTDRTGSIEEGARADLIALNIDAPHLWPTQNLLHTIVECASGRDVVHTIIDGRLVMKDREYLTLDEERIRFEAKEAFRKEPFLSHWS